MIISSKEKLVSMWKFNDLEIDGEFESVSEFLAGDGRVNSQAIVDNEERKEDEEEITLNPMTKKMINIKESNGTGSPVGLCKENNNKTNLHTGNEQKESLFNFSIKPKIASYRDASLSSAGKIDFKPDDKRATLESTQTAKTSKKPEGTVGSPNEIAKDQILVNSMNSKIDISDNEENLIELAKDKDKSKKARDLNDIFFTN